MIYFVYTLSHKLTNLKTSKYYYQLLISVSHFYCWLLDSKLFKTMILNAFVFIVLQKSLTSHVTRRKPQSPHLAWSNYSAPRKWGYFSVLFGLKKKMPTVDINCYLFYVYSRHSSVRTLSDLFLLIKAFSRSSYLITTALYIHCVSCWKQVWREEENARAPSNSRVSSIARP